VEIRSKVVFCAKGVSFSPSLVILSEAKDLCIFLEWTRRERQCLALLRDLES